MFLGSLRSLLSDGSLVEKETGRAQNYFDLSEVDSLVDFGVEIFRRMIILLLFQFWCRFGKVGVKIFCRMSISFPFQFLCQFEIIPNEIIIIIIHGRAHKFEICPKN